MSLAFTNFLILSILTGAVIGTRLRVMALLPVMISALPLTAIFGFAQGSGFTSIAALIGIVVVGLQIGYLVGSVLRFYLAAWRMASRRVEIQDLAKNRIFADR